MSAIEIRTGRVSDGMSYAPRAAYDEVAQGRQRRAQKATIYTAGWVEGSKNRDCRCCCPYGQKEWWKRDEWMRGYRTGARFRRRKLSDVEVEQMLFDTESLRTPASMRRGQL